MALKNRSYYIGSVAEEEAARYLQTLGYEVLSRNFRCRYGELDIVARKGGTLVFLEVRYRRKNSLVRPEESLDRKKIRRLSLAIRDFLGTHNINHRDIRVDLLCMSSQESLDFPGQSPQFTFSIIERMLEF